MCGSGVRFIIWYYWLWMLLVYKSVGRCVGIEKCLWRWSSVGNWIVYFYFVMCGIGDFGDICVCVVDIIV